MHTFELAVGSGIPSGTDTVREGADTTGSVILTGGSAACSMELSDIATSEEEA